MTLDDQRIVDPDGLGADRHSAFIDPNVVECIVRIQVKHVPFGLTFSVEGRQASDGLTRAEKDRADQERIGPQFFRATLEKLRGLRPKGYRLQRYTSGTRCVFGQKIRGAGGLSPEKSLVPRGAVREWNHFDSWSLNGAADYDLDLQGREEVRQLVEGCDQILRPGNARAKNQLEPPPLARNLGVGLHICWSFRVAVEKTKHHLVRA